MVRSDWFPKPTKLESCISFLPPVTRNRLYSINMGVDVLVVLCQRDRDDYATLPATHCPKQLQITNSAPLFSTKQVDGNFYSGRIRFEPLQELRQPSLVFRRFPCFLQAHAKTIGLLRFDHINLHRNPAQFIVHQSF
jgi:hypothetical protein